MVAITDISVRDARRLFLHRQGLLRPNHFGRGRNAVSKAIRALSYLQIDTISVVERAHHHVMKTRVANYSAKLLNDLQIKDRQIFEYWAHAAAYLPLDEYRYCLPVMEGSRVKRKPDPKLAPEIMRRIRDEGPLQSRDFENDGKHKSNGWWDWKPAKRVLEQLYLCGDLMVVRREGFQKVYDLRDNVLPDHIDNSMPTDDQWCEHLVNRQIRSAGIATDYDIGYIRTSVRQLAARNIKKEMQQALDNLLEAGTVIPVNVADTTYYTHAETLDSLPLRLSSKRIQILSPFDNSVINRRRMQHLFDFDYQLECYVPEGKRKYGYFCLPILFGDQLIGRMDAKALRNQQTLLVRNLVMEPDLNITDEMCSALGAGIQDFAADNNCQHVKFDRTSPAGLAKRIA
jgi:uncharacterized protein